MRFNIIIVLLILNGCFHDNVADDTTTELEGVWEIDCLFDTDGNQYYIRSYSFRDNIFTGTVSIYSDSKCSIASFTTDSIATFSIGNETILSTGETVKEIDRIFSTWTLVAESDEITSFFNTNSFCEKSDWIKGEKVDVINCSDLGASVNRYDIFKIEDNKLLFGDGDTGDRKSKDTRPTQLESHYVTKTTLFAGGAQDASAEQSSAGETAASSCINEYFTKLKFPGPLVPLDKRGGGWELAMEPSRIDDKITFYACLPSESAAKDRLERETPSLFVICGIGVIDVAAIVTVDYGVQNDIPVLTKFDGAEPEKSTWRISPDKKAVIAPVSGGEFAKKLMSNSVLSVQLTLSSQELAEFTYDLRGTSDALNTLRQACKWE